MEKGWVFVENWAFTPTDDSAYSNKEYADEKWDTLSPVFKTNRESKGKYKVYPGIGWFRYYFTVDSTMLNKPFALTVSHAGASEVYLDGKLLKKTGKIKAEKHEIDYTDINSSPFIFTIKDSGVHVFAVRYANYYAEKFDKFFNEEQGGFYLAMNHANGTVAREVYIAEITTFITMLIAGVFMALAIVHFLMFLFYRSEVYNFYFSLFNISIALSAYATYLKVRAANPIYEMVGSSAGFFLFLLLIFSITGFINVLFSKSKTRFRIFAFICLAILILRFIFPVVAYISVALMFFVILIETFVVIVIAIAEKVKGAWIVGFGFLFLMVVLFALFAIAIANGGNLSYDDNHATEGAIVLTILCIAFISVPISISAFLAWKFAVVNIDLKKQLKQVRWLSDKTLAQELEKKQLLETQNERLEKEVAERTEEIHLEKKKSDDLLLNILPSEIAEELKLKGESKAHKYDEVSVLFTDFVNFTKISEQLGVDELLHELNVNFTAFDRIMEKHGLEKIKTIGDAYLAVSGLPVANSRHAQNTILAALDILEFVKIRKAEVPYGLDIRIGINSGSLIAGIIGVKKFAYDIWGDTVNTAARMEQNSEAGKINISAQTYELVKEEFACSYRGKIGAKNKGEIDMYFVAAKHEMV
ncbi:MAG TPA: adenylate/guanylate cyclase domain-containing protein [Flavipsychrobacter sp.]|nr:adenylate/guanylate cyclase domain-containing protein [Flavipsychrobacter sp.]